MPAREPWKQQPIRKVLAIIEDARGCTLKLQCGHEWHTQRRFRVGQGMRCTRCPPELPAHSPLIVRGNVRTQWGRDQ